MKLRKLNEKDAEGMLEWMHDPEIQNSFQIDMINRTREDVIEFIRHSRIDMAEGESIHYAIADDADEYLGTISLKNMDLMAKNAEYAICLRKKAQGRGIAVEATRELLKRAFLEFNMERVYLNVLSENRKAIRLYEKCGFVYEGEFRKHLFLKGEYKTLKWYSMLKEEYIYKWGGVNRIYPIAPPVCVLKWLDSTCNCEVA